MTDRPPHGRLGSLPGEVVPPGGTPTTSPRRPSRPSPQPRVLIVGDTSPVTDPVVGGVTPLLYSTRSYTPVLSPDDPV